MSLSYTGLANYHRSPHSYINKCMGVETPETDAMRLGKAVHALVQDHCMGVKKDERLKDLEWNFTSKEWHCRRTCADGIILHGYIDLVNFKSKMLCEIKTGSSGMSQKEFDELVQWKYYAYVTGFRKVLFLSLETAGTPEDIYIKKIHTEYREVTDKDVQEATEWAATAIEGIKAGRFYDDLEGGRCQRGRECPYANYCLFI